MNAVVPLPERQLTSVPDARMDVGQVLAHTRAVQEIMRSVMKEGVHYGKVPGTDKPTLLKPGAELLCMVFHIAPSFRVEDLSTETIRYRVTCTGTHQLSRVVMGDGMGEASGGEEKYKWRRPVCDEEFEDTPGDRRRFKYARGNNGTTYKNKQIRTEPADAANTVLKMAIKRAHVAMVLHVLAVSDMFNQDLEDLDASLRQLDADNDSGGQQQGGQQQKTGTGGLPAWTDEALGKRELIYRGFLTSGKTHDEIIAFAKTKGTLTEAQEQRIRELKPLNAEAASGSDQAQQQPQADPPPAEKKEEAPAITYAHVADRIAKAANLDQLGEAEDLIGSIADTKQRAEAVELAQTRRTELEG
jgi:hypothetical protein